MKQSLTVGLLVTIFHFFADCQNVNFKPSFSTTIEASKASKLLNQCSRSTPKNIKGFWTPTQNDIEILESNFGNITKITSKECCFVNAKVDSLQNFAFQYVGVVVNGKKLIYINAFPLEDIVRFKQVNYDPSKMPVVACDGSSYYWGALFDPQTKQFSSLAFNGYG